MFVALWIMWCELKLNVHIIHTKAIQTYFIFFYPKFYHDIAVQPKGASIALVSLQIWIISSFRTRGKFEGHLDKNHVTQLIGEVAEIFFASIYFYSLISALQIGVRFYSMLKIELNCLK